MSHIFISYSRKDLEHAGQIVQALAENHLDTWVDWKSIPKGEDWWERIQNGIEEADAFLFLVSPNSARSKVCRSEIAHAVLNGKRILPILLHDTDSKIIPAEIAKLNWISCREEVDDFERAIEETRATIHTDYNWLKFHTELQVKALKWERHKDVSRLLRGKELIEAEKWLKETGLQTDPQTTDLQRNFVLESRKAVKRQQRILAALAAGAMLIVIALGIYGSFQTRTSRARELATAAQSILQERPQESLLLSIEALKALNPGDPDIPSVNQSLRDALLQSGGIALGQGAVIDVAPVISPDNHWLVTGTDTGTVQLWDLTGPSLPTTPRVFPAHEDPIQAVTISPDGRWLISASTDTEVRLWDLSGSMPGDSSTILTVSECSISTLAASPDGHWLVIGCDNDTVKIWDLEKFDPASPLISLSHEEAPSDDSIFGPGVGMVMPDRQRLIDIDANSRWLALASWDIVFLWDLDTPALYTKPITLSGHIFPIITLAISPNNSWLATADAKTILLWDLAHAGPGMQPTVLSEGFQVAAIGFSPDGSQLAGGNIEGWVRLWSLASPDPANAIFDIEGQAESMYALAISPDGHWLITAGKDVRLLDLSTQGHFLPPLILRGYEYPVTALRVSPNSLWLATLSTDSAVRIWNLSSPQPTASPVTLWAHEGNGNIGLIAASPKANRWLVTSGGNGIVLWELTTPDFYKKYELLSRQPAAVMAVSPDNHWLAADGEAGSLRLFDLEQPGEEPLQLAGHQGPVSGLAFSPDSRWLASAGTGQAFLWDLTAKNIARNPVALPGQAGDVPVISFSPRGRWLAAASPAGTLLWNLSTGNPVEQPVAVGGRELPAEGVAFSPDERWLVAGEDDLYFLDLNTPSLKARYEIKGAGTPAAISPDNHWLVVMKEDLPRLIKMNNPGATPIPLVGHEGKITSLVISPDGHWLATGSWDNTARLWNLKAGNPSETAVVLRPPAQWLPHVNRLAITPDSHWLVMGVEAGSIYVWTLRQDELVSQACQTAGRNLYKDEWTLFFSEKQPATCPQWPVEE